MLITEESVIDGGGGGEFQIRGFVQKLSQGSKILPYN